jgi:Zn-dependent metalloprotease
MFLKNESDCFIIPEYVNKKIYENGTQKQKTKAWRNLVTTEQLRGRRSVSGFLQPLMSRSTGLFRTVYDAMSSENLPGMLIITEGGKTKGKKTKGGIVVAEAFDYSKVVYDFYKKIFERNSINDNGMRLDSTVHFGDAYNNAFWNGTQMVYGDGDGDVFNRFTVSIDVIGHELTHGITQYEAALEYEGESGALNESFSDVFGSMIRQHYYKQTVDEADWLIGKGIFTRKIKGTALRSMKEPGTAYDDPLIGKDQQRGHIKDYYKGSDDNGGVHINSGIPNKAFYLAASEMGGYAWEKAGKIWYITLRDRLRERSSFRKAANTSFEVAGSLYGKGSQEQRAIKRAWKQVGIQVDTK